jgi:hypothetical protein
MICIQCVSDRGVYQQGLKMSAEDAAAAEVKVFSELFATGIHPLPVRYLLCIQCVSDREGIHHPQATPRRVARRSSRNGQLRGQGSEVATASSLPVRCTLDVSFETL